MDRAELYDKLADILADQLGIKKESIAETSLIAGDLGADSLDMAEINMMIKDQFDFDLTDDEAAKIKTVKDIVECIELKLRVD